MNVRYWRCAVDIGRGLLSVGFGRILLDGSVDDSRLGGLQCRGDCVAHSLYVRMCVLLRLTLGDCVGVDDLRCLVRGLQVGYFHSFHGFLGLYRQLDAKLSIVWVGRYIVAVRKKNG